MDATDATVTLDHYFQALEAEQQFSGVVLITRGASQLFAAGYGYASRVWSIRNTLAMRFDTASITKLFTAVATLQLIEQGQLAFDTSAIDFLDLEGTAISREVTVFHLLTHTSGIGDDADEEAGESYAATTAAIPPRGKARAVIVSSKLSPKDRARKRGSRRDRSICCHWRL